MADGTALTGADIVVLAVKYPGTKDFAAQHAAELVGKTVIDIANPADFSTFDPLTSPGTSAAEELAAEIPQANVVKAFNTTFAGNLLTGQAYGEPLDVFVNGTLIAHGEVVVVNEKFGIRLTDVISPAERIRKLR